MLGKAAQPPFGFCKGTMRPKPIVQDYAESSVSGTRPDGPAAAPLGVLRCAVMSLSVTSCGGGVAAVGGGVVGVPGASGPAVKTCRAAESSPGGLRRADARSVSHSP